MSPRDTHRGKWSERMQAQKTRTRSLVVFRPPCDLWRKDGWHIVETQDGRTRRVFWVCGIDVWRDSDGQRWTAGTAGDLGWKYVGLDRTEMPPGERP